MFAFYISRGLSALCLAVSYLISSYQPPTGGEGFIPACAAPVLFCPRRSAEWCEDSISRFKASKSFGISAKNIPPGVFFLKASFPSSDGFFVLRSDTAEYWPSALFVSKRPPGCYLDAIKALFLQSVRIIGSTDQGPIPPPPSC